MRASLTTAAPEIAFFGEEDGGERAEVGWFVDPLDGTANFVHGFPLVGVSIGLVVDGRARRRRGRGADARRRVLARAAAGARSATARRSA